MLLGCYYTAGYTAGYSQDRSHAQDGPLSPSTSLPVRGFINRNGVPRCPGGGSNRG